MSNNKDPLVVLRSSDICFLGILRSCRAANIPVIPVTFTWPIAPVWYSEFSSCFRDGFEISNPFTEPVKAVDQLKAIFKDLKNQYGKKLMVLPSSDTNMMFLMDNFDHFSPYINMMGGQVFSEPRYDIIHKFECSKLLEQSCPEVVPLTLRCSSHMDIENIVDQMVYPAIYKPAVKDYGQTFYRTHHGNKAIQCDSAQELKERLSLEIDAGFDLVVQEKLIFDSVYDEIPFYLYADGNGHISMAGNGIKELIEPYPFGTAIILRFAWYPELLDLAEKVVQALSYHGILMIEFVKDQKDGNWKVVEVNPRHWLFNGFYQRLGLNYSDALYQDMHKQEQSSMPLVIAKPEVLGKNYVHVDFFAVAENWMNDDHTLTFEKYLSKLDQIEGSLSSVYLDPNDLMPGIERTSAMLEKYEWPKSGMDKILKRLVL